MEGKGREHSVAAFTRVLDEASAVLPFKDKVYLHHDKKIEYLQLMLKLMEKANGETSQKELGMKSQCDEKMFDFVFCDEKSLYKNSQKFSGEMQNMVKEFKNLVFSSFIHF
ncbi:hypothetical protein ACSBR1_012167 [Camellia fascicularis]